MNNNELVFRTIEEFDEIIRNKGKKATDVIAENGHLIYQREFVKRVGYDNIMRLYVDNVDLREGIEYLYLSETALAYFIEANPYFQGMSYERAVKNFCEIFNAHKDEIKEDWDFLLKLAISVAFAMSRNLGMWTGHFKPNDPVVRYEAFKQLVEEGLMAKAGGDVEKFKALPSALMCFTVNTRAHSDELIWLNRHITKRRDNGLGTKYLDPYQYIVYGKDWSYAHPDLQNPDKFDEWNKKWDIECFKHDYTDNRYVRHWKVFKKQAVCGGISKSGSNFNNVIGYPAFAVSQKGHCAYHYSRYDKDNNIIWYIGNNITHIQDSRSEQSEGLIGGYGVKSWCSDRSASYIQLATAVLSDYSLYQKAVKLNILADVYKDDFLRHRGIFLETLKVMPLNLDALENVIMIDTANEALESSHFVNLAKTVIENLKYYPLPMRDLLKLVEARISVEDRPYFDLLRNNALINATKIANGTIVQSDVCKQMATFLLQSQRVNLATFSFDGEKANKLVVNQAYKDSGIQIKYSLDGGVEWVTGTSHEIELDPTTVTTKGILVRIVGFEDQTHKIDITTAKNPTTALISKNDNENYFVGNIKNLQYSGDGISFVDYPVNGVFSGTQKVYVRYKNYGTFLASGIEEYTFHENTDTATRKYLPIKHLKMQSASSEQSKSSEHKATNMLDGDSRTKWHTKYGGDAKREYVIKLDEARHICSIEYIPAGRNGRLRQAEIQVSDDNKTWKPVIVSEELKDDGYLKKIDFPATKCLYIKIIGKKTWGNNVGERDRFFSGTGFNVYYDSTK